MKKSEAQSGQREAEHAGGVEATGAEESAMNAPMMQPNRDQELAVIYNELRVVARSLLRREPYNHTLESCELVNQAWTRVLSGSLGELAAADPKQVVALAVTNMRRELIDHARRRRAAKRPDAKIRISFEDAPLQCRQDPDTVLAIDALLDELEAGPDRVRNGARKARAARFAFYGGLSEAEISAAMELPKSTVGADVRFARAWLQQRLAAG